MLKLQVIKSTAFATQLFQDTVTPGHDVGGDHAWVDDTKKHVWISTFRLGNPGVHMVDYETGKLLYSIHGIDSYLEDNYSYSAGTIPSIPTLPCMLTFPRTIDSPANLSLHNC